MTGTCEHCRDQLWDLLYELLEPEQSTRLRAHLAACASCAEGFRIAQLQQQRIARVARLNIEVPPFVRPQEKVETRPTTLPFRRRLVVAALSAAAALLLAVGLPVAWYEAGTRNHAATLAEAAARFTAVEGERKQEYQKASRDQQGLLANAGKEHLRLQVVGPAAYQRGATATHHILVTDLHGQPADATVTARILAADHREVYRTTQKAEQGTLVVSLPPNLEDRSLRLELLAVRNDARAHLTEALPMQQADLVTHLAVSKPLYRPGDLLFFRSLTLERFSRTPATTPREVHFRLTDPDNRLLHEAHSQVGEGGIAGGALELPRRDVKEGEYTLTVVDPKGQFAPQAQRVSVKADKPVKLKKSLEFDRPSYRPGDKVAATIQAHRISTGQPVAKQRVFGHLLADGVATTLQARTDEQGVARIAVQLPEQVGRSARLSVVISDPGNTEALEREIPLEAPGVAVEFFPEGGDLIGGVPNRVYFRARTSRGEPVALDGSLVDGQGRQIVTARTAANDRRHGLGVFTFTPQPLEMYNLVSADGKQRFALPPAHAEGVHLSTPAAVVKQGDAVPVAVQVVGSPRTVLVAAFYRGRLVAMESLAAVTGRRDLTLAVPPELGGVLRLTAFAEEGELRPVAERLIYRTPSQRLHVAVETSNRTPTAGERVKVAFRTTNEAGSPLPAWLLAAVVDQDAAGLSGAPGQPTLPTHFHLLAELRRPEDLEDTDFLLSAHPQAAESLDLFLGTQGWRRFRETPAVAQRETAAAALAKLDNAAEAWRTCETELAAALTDIRQQGGDRERELFGQQEQEYAAALLAHQALEGFQASFRSNLYHGILVGLALCSVLMAVALVLAVVSLRRSRLERPVFALLLGGGVLLLSCTLTWEMLTARMTEPAGQPVVWGKLPRRPLGIEPVSPLLAARHTPARQVAAIPAGSDLATGPLPINLVRLEEQVERRSFANGTAGRPIRSATPGQQIGVPVSIPNPDEIARPTPPRPAPAAARLRDYAYLPDAAAKPPTELPDTVLWHPALLTKDGQAEVELTLPRPGATYRLLIQAHDATGRLGVTQTELRTAPRGAP